MLDRTGLQHTQTPSCSGRPCSAGGVWSREARLSFRSFHDIKAFLKRRCTALDSTSIVREPAPQQRRSQQLQTRSVRRRRQAKQDDKPLAVQNTCTDFLRAGRVPLLLASSIGVLELFDLCFPAASAAGETVPVELLSNFLETVEHLGIYGPVVFVATVIGAEMVPLFPTQPLSIASGLLFGATKGSVLALTGTTVAAIMAFQLSRKLGRRLAERVIAEEITDEEQKKGIFAKVQDAVDSGSLRQQLVAVALLRLTPVVPFSASNYLLGATPLKFEAYLGGSLLGLSFWCILFATLGGASREVLQSGLSPNVILEELMGKASGYTEDIAAVAAGLGIAALLFFKLGPQDSSHGSDSGDKEKDELGDVLGQGDPVRRRN